MFCAHDTAALAENGRLNKVSGVLGAFAKIMSAHRGEVMCSVTTAKVSLTYLITNFLLSTSLTPSTVSKDMSWMEISTAL